MIKNISDIEEKLSNIIDVLTGTNADSWVDSWVDSLSQCQ